MIMARRHAASCQGFNLRDKESDTSPDQLEPPCRCCCIEPLIGPWLSIICQNRVFKISSSQQGFLFHLMTQILQQAYKSTLSSNPTLTSNVIQVSGVGVKTCWAVEYTWLHVLGLRFHFICHGIHYNGWGPLRRSAGQETLFLWSFLHSRLIFLPHKTSNILIIIVITFTMNCVVNCHTKEHLAECGGYIVSLSYKYEDQGCGTESVDWIFIMLVSQHRHE